MALTPFRESGCCLLMEVLERLRNIAEALRLCESLRLCLREEPAPYSFPASTTSGVPSAR